MQAQVQTQAQAQATTKTTKHLRRWVDFVDGFSGPQWMVTGVQELPENIELDIDADMTWEFVEDGIRFIVHDVMTNRCC